MALSYYDTTITNESPPPFAYWHMNETSGTTAHDSLSGHYDGPLSGASFGVAGAINGDPDTAIAFTGAGTFAFPPALTALIQTWTALTIEIWIKQTGLWEHVVILATTTSVSYYLDGLPYTSGAGDPVYVAQDFSFIGSPNAGDLAKIAVYNYNLSAAQIKNHFLVGQLILNGGPALAANGTGTASFDSFRATVYPDPSAPLANAGRAANSVVNWNGNIPANTSLSVYTSVDNGITWQLAPNAGATIPGISTLLYNTLNLQRKPSGYYRLNDIPLSGVGTTADASGNGNTGTLHGGVSQAASGPLQGPGELGSTAATFNGSNAFIALASGLKTDGWSNLAISCWFKPLASVGAATYLIANDNPASSHNGLAIGINASLAGCFATIGNGTTSATATFSTALTSGSWYMLTVVFDGVAGTITVYLNNNQVATASLTGSVGVAAQALAIGYNPALASGYINASMAEVSFTNPTIANAVAPFVASDILARYNAALCQVGTVANDSFTADTHTNYTNTFGSGGSASVNTWDTANSRLIMTGGSKAVLLYNNLDAFDTDIWVDILQAENAGITWGWQNNKNYYELIVKDRLAGSGPNTATINKISGGVSTQLATTAITWQVVTGGVTIDQVHHRFHTTMLDGVISVSMDENTILTYTDSAPLPAGASGLRNDTGTSYIYLFQVTPQAADLTATALCSKHVLSTTDPTQTPQITDHQAMASNSSFGIGSIVPSVDYSNKYVSDNFDDLNKRSGYWWQVGDTNVTFQARNAVNAPYILQSSDILVNSTPTVEYSGDMYRNEMVLTGVFNTSIFNQSFAGDGNSKTWNVANPIQSPPTILLNGLAQTVGLQGVDTGKAFYWTKNGTAIQQDSGGTTLQSTDVLSIAYLGAYGIDFSLSNTGQIANTISQAQYATTDGTSGIVDAIEDVSSQNMDLDAATDYANQLLQRYGSMARTITFDTLHPGLKAGHSLTVFVPQLNIFDSVFLVVEVTTTERKIANGTQLMYHVVASEAAAMASWVKYFSKIMRSVTGSRPKA